MNRLIAPPKHARVQLDQSNQPIVTSSGAALGTPSDILGPQFGLRLSQKPETQKIDLMAMGKPKQSTSGWSNRVLLPGVEEKLKSMETSEDATQKTNKEAKSDVKDKEDETPILKREFPDDPEELQIMRLEGRDARLAEMKAAKEKADQERAKDRSAADAAARKLAKEQSDVGAFYIEGSWDDWMPHELVYNPVAQCFSCILEPAAGPAKFHILMDGNPDLCMYPLVANATVRAKNAVGGPDDESEGRMWNIQAVAGVKYEAKLFVGEDFYRPTLHWEKIEKPIELPARKYWIVGTWDEWKPHEMCWDPKRHCYYFFVEMGASGRERFHLLVNGDPEMRLYPQHSVYFNGLITGPDNKGADKNWEIGKYDLDQGDQYTFYEVRLRTNAEGGALDIDWVRVSDKHKKVESVVPAKEDVEEAMLQYSQRLAEKEAEAAEKEQALSDGSTDEGGQHATENDSDSSSEDHREDDGSPQSHEVRAQLKKELSSSRKNCSKIDQGTTILNYDSDGEKVDLCRHCGLPMGEVGYEHGRGVYQKSFVHGECLAQQLIDELRQIDEKRLQEDADMKKKKREEYDIGWKIARIPRSVGMAKKLGLKALPQGMCCLILNEEKKRVTVKPTIEPGASVNLAYLSLALQVRLREGREPWFSLDPIKSKQRVHDPKLPEVWMQEKVFEPAWLAGTSLGEIMFQADYHLKELSMGEYDQPFLGMKNCHDYSVGDYYDSEWHAREWFVINKAEIKLSDDNILLPQVKMGVEARELDDYMKDKKMTRPDHPMVRYAEEFTKKFDLMAERKSVLFNLREAAKATILAKYLFDAEIKLDDCWMNLADEEMTGTIMEIPQLWNEKVCSKIRLQDGQIDEDKTGHHGVYGGVQFGLERFAVAQPTRITQKMGQVRMPVLRTVPTQPLTQAQASLGAAAQILQPRAPTQAVGVSGAVAAPTMPTRVGIPRAGAAAPLQAQGVDLDLGRFDLSQASRTAKEESIVDASLVIGNAFWDSISDSSSSLFKDEDLKLMKAIFNPNLSDRKDEGDLFIPPVTSGSYLKTLRELTKEEDTLRQKRDDHFFSIDFAKENAGPLFPHSWKPAFDIDRKQVTVHNSKLHPRPDYKAEAEVFEQHLQSASPTFDKKCEDGLRYRIYTIGGVEVRTKQQPGGKEEIGAVFSISAPRATTARGSIGKTVDYSEKIVKVTQYVEQGSHRYIVLETECGNKIVTELCRDGSVTFEEHPTDLEDRNSLAKVMSCTERNSDAQTTVTVADMRRLADGFNFSTSGSQSQGKRYARVAHSRASAETHRCYSPSIHGLGSLWQQWFIKNMASSRSLLAHN